MGNTCNGGDNSDYVFTAPGTGVQARILRTAGFGWKPDLPDIRDRVVVIPAAQKSYPPPNVDLRPKDALPIYNQGNLGSCTAQAICAAAHYAFVQQGLRAFPPSRLFVYYNERKIDQTVDSDAGSSIRTGMKTLSNFGVCDEDCWPYDIRQFRKQPSEECYKQAKKNMASETGYARVQQNLDDIKTVLSKGFVFCFGFRVLDSFMTSDVEHTGKMPMPQSGDRVVGGHAVMCCGYDDDRRVFIIRNSWGEDWGDKGFFYMPYDYMTSRWLTMDLWVLTEMGGNTLQTETLQSMAH